jgi:hypothetical protein
MTANDRPRALESVARWAQDRDDVALWVWAVRTLVQIAPDRRPVALRAAEQLAGLGDIGQAQATAAAAVDASAEPLTDGYPLSARLALDAVIFVADAATIADRATRVRLPVDEAAARALLAGRPSIARELALRVIRADPDALGGQLVLSAIEGSTPSAAGSRAREHARIASSAAWLVFGMALASRSPREVARTALGTIPHDPLVGGDDRELRAAAELALAGVIDVSALPADGRVEVWAMRGEMPSGVGAWELDRRHELLQLSLAQPGAARARELAERLGALAPDDRIVLASRTLVQAAGSQKPDPALASALLSQDPADPLLAITALRIAERAGDLAVAQRARERVGSLRENMTGREGGKEH